ncbi:hypothetical protein WT20_10960 [Burkholderia stagnalis]|nr:hypothetical protein WT20_10960 [Burkholderia stagnalis]
MRERARLGSIIASQAVQQERIPLLAEVATMRFAEQPLRDPALFAALRDMMTPTSRAKLATRGFP